MTFLADYMIPFLIVLTILVFVHELGHFLVARWNGVKVDVFSIGFGPELFGWTDRLQTRWKFSLIPLGGYIKMLGDADASSRPDEKAIAKMDNIEKSQTLQSKTPLQRIAISFAGPLANFIFAIVVMTFIFLIKGQPHLPATIGDVKADMLAAKSGLLAGDKIIKFNAAPVQDFNHLRTLITANVGQDISLEINRPQQEAPLNIKIALYTVDPTTHNRVPISKLGIHPGEPEYIKHGPLQAVGQAVIMTFSFCYETCLNLVQMIAGKRSGEDFGGILAIGDMAGQSAKGGVFAVLWFMALLSVNLGFINLLPIPVLDGGHIMLYTIEAIRGKAVNEKIQEYIFLAGFIVVIGTMIMTTWNDLSRYKVIHWILSIFKNYP